MLVNKNATGETKRLYEYLEVVSSEGKYIFGHQNSAHIYVYENAEGNSDVKELTGSYPGIIGLDSLSLTGNEMESNSQEEAVQKCIELSKNVVKEGVILTLSTHLPNFSDDRFEPDDGVYDYRTADFLDCKNLSGNCAKEILPGGAYNNRYNAYLDLIVTYAKGIGDIPVLFRPLHENNGDWFWWGSITSIQTYQELFQYTVRYLTQKGVNNFLYVYSPNGPFSSMQDYMERYPGDEYIDIVAFDYYDDYLEPNETYREKFMDEMKETSKVVAEVAKLHNKIPAISETGSRVMRENGKNDGLAMYNNPMKGHNWYIKIGDIAIEYGIPYYLVWGNFEATNSYLPFKISKNENHEMAEEFIDLYHCENSIFADETKFYRK